MRLWLARAFIGEYEVMEVLEYQTRMTDRHIARSYVKVRCYNHITGEVFEDLTFDRFLTIAP